MSGALAPAPAASWLTARGVCKRFGGVNALDGLDFDLPAGEIVALLGKNGAGKSTFMQILAGAHPAGSYQGALAIDGRPFRPGGVADAEAAGVALVPQEIQVAPELSVAETLFLNREPTRGGLIDRPRRLAEARRALGALDLEVDPRAPIGTLDLASQQLVIIARALARNARLLILDEPTAALTGRETRRLFDRLRRLKAQGTSCIFVSHRLAEVFAIADRIVVMRDGKVCGEFATPAPAEDVIEAMLGETTREKVDPPAPRDCLPSPRASGERERVRGGRQGRSGGPSPLHPKPADRLGDPALPLPAARGEGEQSRWGEAEDVPSSASPVVCASASTVLDVDRLVVREAEVNRRPRVNGVSFSLRRGEILGLFGLRGAGCSSLAAALFGAWAGPVSGAIRLRGQPVQIRTPVDAVAQGIGLVAQDRRDGLLFEHSIAQNIALASLPALGRRGFLDVPRMRRMAAEQMAALAIRAPGIDAPAGTLSGGNQQKVQLARWLASGVTILLLVDPTRGIDIGARREIHDLWHQLAARGYALLVISSEAEELLQVCHRVLVLRDGEVAAELPVAGAAEPPTEERLLRAAAGL